MDLITNVETSDNTVTVMENVHMQVGNVIILMKDITGTQPLRIRWEAQYTIVHRSDFFGPIVVI